MSTIATTVFPVSQLTFWLPESTFRGKSKKLIIDFSIGGRRGKQIGSFPPENSREYDLVVRLCQLARCYGIGRLVFNDGRLVVEPVKGSLCRSTAEAVERAIRPLYL